MPVNTGQSPYNDDYNALKQYTEILAVPGRVEQAREFTQIQTMLLDMLKRLSDTIFKNGDIISGMAWSFTDNDTILVEDGYIYINGIIHKFKQQEIAVTKVGHEVIGVSLEESIVTEQTDSSLRDPAQNMENYGQPGAHRRQSIPVLKLNDASASTIYEFQDGSLQVDVPRPQFSSLDGILARRTYNESGNYRVSGLTLDTQPKDASNITLVVEAGLAYVMGYEVNKPTPTKVDMPISKDLQTSLNEPKTYVNGTSLYLLNHSPMKDILNVVAIVEKTVTVTRGAQTNGIDYLPDASIVSLQSVTAGATTYVQGTDFTQTGDGVDWGPVGGLEPTSGSSYTVVYRYNKTMIQGTDYDHYFETDAWGVSKDYIRFLSGDRPVDDSQFNSDYTYYLARIDVVGLDKTGTVIHYSGQPDVDRLVSAPKINDPSILALGSVYFPPNSANVVPSFSTITRMTMQDLQNLSNRVDNVEYNVAISALDQETISNGQATDMKGVFSDNFTSTERGDISNPDFTTAYSLEDGEIMLAIGQSSPVTPNPNLPSSSVKIWGRLVTAPFTENLAVSQQYATTTKKINPYLAFNVGASLSLDPEVDNWIDESTMQVYDENTETRVFYRWWKHKGQDATNLQAKDIASTADLDNSALIDSWRPDWSAQDLAGRTATKTTVSDRILEDSIAYMRQRDVQISLSNLEPSTDNLVCYFDDIQVPLTPRNGTVSGTTAGSVKSDSNGRAYATFTVPTGVKCGTREVRVQNNSNTAISAYTANGTKKTTVETILRTKVLFTPEDPLAQSFQFDRDTFLTSVGVYFAAKDLVNNAVIQIRNMVNGTPGTIVYAEKTLLPTDISYNATASIETKVTFDDPIVCQANTQYCIVIESNSATDAIYISNLGEADVATGAVVQKRPYLAGVMFSSANGISWTSEQNSLLKFNLYTATFAPTGVLQFDALTNINSSTVLMLANYLTPTNTGCIWEVNIDDGGYVPISSYQEKDMDKVVNKVQLKATFQSNNGVSPILALDSLTLVGFLSSTSGSYIGRNVVVDESYNHVTMVIDATTIQGTTITPQFSYDGGTTWVTPTQTTSKQVSSQFTEFTYDANVADAASATNFRARVNMTANSPVLSPRVKRLRCIMNHL